MFRWLLVVLVLYHFVDSSTVGTPQTATSNYCTRIGSFSEEHVVRQSKKEKVFSSAWCLSFTLRCTDYKYETVYYNTTITVNKTRIVRDCCPGYNKENGTCQPVCKLSCGHGECVAPDKCLCESGWKDPLCMSECDDNTYGHGCKDNCTCFNGAVCDSKTGFCYCRKGYTGDFCEHPCPENTYGVNCNQRCLCENDAICNRENGSCQCQEGYLGKFCEKKCEDGTHGKNCNHECVCIQENTETCHHIDGKCLCKIGYKGNYCEKQCGNFTYGRDCNKVCTCVHAEFCDPFNGKCICKPGWTGLKCKDKCPDGYFGHDCKFKCNECLNISGNCNPETGLCSCPAGSFGDLCEKKCSPGLWGSNCSEICDCGEDSICNPVTGVCLCDRGENGSFCVENCTAMPNGELCATQCGCYCNASTGFCNGDPTNLVSSLLADSENRAFVSIILVCLTLLCLGSIVLLCIVKKDSFLKYFKSRNQGTSRECLPDSHFVNPLYGQNDKDDVVVLDLNPAGSIVRYFKNKLDTEENMDTKEKPSENSLTAKSTDSGSKRSSILEDLSSAFNPIRSSHRTSKGKVDSTYASTNDLEKDFQPEVLGDFTIAENN